MNSTTFSAFELMTKHHEWTELVHSRKDTLLEETKEWLSAWEYYYSHLENVPDEWVQYLRAGHFVGYYQAKRNDD